MQIHVRKRKTSTESTTIILFRCITHSLWLELKLKLYVSVAKAKKTTIYILPYLGLSSLSDRAKHSKINYCVDCINNDLL